MDVVKTFKIKIRNKNILTLLVISKKTLKKEIYHNFKVFLTKMILIMINIKKIYFKKKLN